MITRHEKKFKLPRRLIAFLLCLCIIMSTVSGVGIMTAFAAYFGPTQNIIGASRKADPNTMDSYLNRLLTDETGSRYAGRVWTDKTVFAYDASVANGGVGSNLIPLDMLTDGYNGKVGFNADFAHVFSALASSQVVNEYPPTPVDLVIVFDMSGSMGQDTRYGIDAGQNIYVDHNKDNDKDENGNVLEGAAAWPETGVPMDDRIKNSRIQATLNAINQTIDKLMAQNPQNRVAVCGYGANAAVLMPLGHYKRVDINNDGEIDENDPYLSVGGMETLYHPSDLVYREHGDNVTKNGVKLEDVGVGKDGWYWMNNRDTCYTVVVNAQYNTYTGVLNADGDGKGQDGANPGSTDEWTKIQNYTVSNNVLSDDGEQVKAFPGVENWVNGKPADTYKEISKKVYEGSSSSDEKEAKRWVGGFPGIQNCSEAYTEKGYDSLDKSSELKKIMGSTKGLEADDYVGYFTNTQGGIYLAYKQLADSTATTYTEPLSNGVISTVARIPAAIIMSDGGANFSFNEMGQDDQQYTAEDWNARYGQRHFDGGTNLNYLTDDGWTSDNTLRWRSLNGMINGRNLVDGRYHDYDHRLNRNLGDEWYNVFIPGEDTLEGWNGLHGIYNLGADITEDGTLSTQPNWDQPGVFYSSDNSPVDAPGTILEVLLTAAYMHDVVKTHYNNGWTTDGATEESRSDLFTYTMNVDTEHVPQWGKMRLFPTLNPKSYPLDTIKSEKWYEKTEQFGDENLADNKTLTEVYDDLYKSWSEWKSGGTTKATIANKDDATKVTINSIESVGNNAADYETSITKKDGTTQPDTVHVTDDDVIKNIAYNDDFFDVTSENLDTTFNTILELILGKVFVPVSGSNEAGVGDSITYQDPIGEYMEIKNGSIMATPYHTNEDLGISDRLTYDMSMLLFGEMHGLVRAGVYDYKWNDDYMKNKEPEYAGESPFDEGWYKGDDPETAIKAGDDNLEDGSFGKFPREDPETHKKYNDSADAWNDGWVYRLSFASLVKYVPIVDAPEDNLPKNLSQQVKNTVYTCYRFSCNSADQNMLRRNPIFGEGIPAELQTAWDEATKGGVFPDDNKIYKDYPGVYRLNDIRVWYEDTGNFVDTDGAIAPNSGYDLSLYLNVPASAVPTQLATVTLGKDGVKSYRTNLGSDHPAGSYDVDSDGNKIQVSDEMYQNYCWQSTPLRLFYAVGLSEDLIERDQDGNQVGVDISKISGEYIASHSDPTTNNIYFISNYYSNSSYEDYVTDSQTSRTRGDPTVTFSPGSDNRYYVFQKPLTLYAHAYRASGGTLTEVDGKPDGGDWPDDKHGNGETVWIDSQNGEKGGGSWGGGEFMGVYESEDTFNAAYLAAQESDDGYIKDDTGTKYLYVADGIVFLEEDLLNHVTSDADGKYEKGSVSFSSDDYFFLLLEYYVPDGGIGTDLEENEVAGTVKGHEVQYVLARKGSEFGSGYNSANISNGDMLCWTDSALHMNYEMNYLSRSDTGDNTRGEPTFEKLTYTGSALKEYLAECGIKNTGEVTWIEGETEKKGTYLEREAAYWESVQADPIVKGALEQAKAAVNDGEELTSADFNKYFSFAVAARPGGIRTGDMANNRQAKSENTTGTAYSYYLPTVSENSGTDDDVILNSYLGNNGRLEVANSTLMATKILAAPEGFTLTAEQKKQDFDYQVYIANISGERSAQRLKWNPFSDSWQKRIESLDILTDNSSLLFDKNSNRALFCCTDGKTAKQVVAVNENGETKYYYADENGDATDTLCSEINDSDHSKLYYMYLPSDLDEHVYKLFGSDYVTGTTDIEGAGTTAYYPAEMDESNLPKGDTGSQTLAKEIDGRPAGSRDYWTSNAKLIPYDEVQSAETVDNGVSGVSWNYDSLKEDGYTPLDKFTLVTVIPDVSGTDSTVYSPFSSRTQYMTVKLYFGYTKALAGHLQDSGETFSSCEDLNDYKLNAGGVYDKIVPTADRPDLFSGITNDKIAQNTAEFTLKSEEGLMLTGLGNRIVYRFTEKLTEDQMQNGYSLKEISHVQQRGSDTVYMPGVQEIPLYKNGDGSVTWAIGQGGTAERTDITPQYEPFAHTNATIWESYATMAAGALGNHHQPEASEGGVPAKNPNCNDAKTEAELDVGKCDLAQDDGTTRHYFYYGGKLVDPHYEGEVEGMSRYVLNPTAHFGVEDETVTSSPAANPEEGYYDYNGVYSTFGNTGYFSEQANYINTIEPGKISVSKKLEPGEGAQINDDDRKTEFDFTLKLDQLEDPSVALTASLRYTISGPGAEDEVSGKMPVYDAAGANEPDPNGVSAIGEDEWAFRLRGDQTITVEGMPIESGYTYTAVEKKSDGYSVEDNEGGTDTDAGHTVTGKVEKGSRKPHTVIFTNVKQPVATLNISKAVKNEDESPLLTEQKDKTFDVTVSFTLPKGGSWKLSEEDGALSYEAKLSSSSGDGTLKIPFEKSEDGGKITYTGTFTVKDGQKYRFTDLPDGTEYSVTEKLSKPYEPSASVTGDDGAVNGPADETGYTVTGKLNATVTDSSGAKVPAEVTVDFTNTNPKPSPALLSLEKKLNVIVKDGASANGEFEFTVTPDPANDKATDPIRSRSEFDEASGKMTLTMPFDTAEAVDGRLEKTLDIFKNEEFTSEGKYVYTVEEADGNAPNMVYDKSVYKAEIDVRKISSATGEKDKLEASLTLTRNGEAAELLEFENTYSLYHVKLALAANKKLTGTSGSQLPLKGGEFVFKLTAGDCTYENGGSGISPMPQGALGGVSTAKNGADGSVLFGEIDFTREGKYTYTVSEAEPAESSPYFEIGTDSRAYNVTVTVTRLENGELAANAVYSLPDGTESRVADFDNQIHLGDMTVTKTVTGAGSEKDRAFHFTVTFTQGSAAPADDGWREYAKVVHSAGGAFDWNGNELSFELKNGESLTVTDLPAGMDYSVKEREADQDNYKTTYTADPADGKIPDGGEAQIEVNNDRPEPKPSYVPIRIVKNLIFEAGSEDANVSGVFTFTVTSAAGNDEATDPLHGGVRVLQTKELSIGDSDVLEILGEKDVFTAEGTYIYTVKELPGNIPGVSYDSRFFTVKVEVKKSETDPESYTYTYVPNVTVTDSEGNTVAQGTLGNPIELNFDNKYDAYEIQAGIGAEKKLLGAELEDGMFTFELTAETDSNGNISPMPEGVSGKKMKASCNAGGSVSFGSITYNTEGIYSYTLREIKPLIQGNIEYDETVYDVKVTVSKAESGEGFTANVTYSSLNRAQFINSLKPGDLTVTKTVTGEAGDLSKDWHFRVELSDTGINGTFGEMDFVDGVAEFTLKSGESATAKDLRAGITYTVTEEEANLDGYETSYTGETGTIPSGDTAKADFLNHKDPPPPEKHYGDLTVTKTVTGEAGDVNKEWHFRVELSDTGINGTFGEMDFVDGVAEFVLKSGESATAKDLPAGITYAVTEEEANLDGYETTSTGENGVIPEDGTVQADFLNHKDPPPPPEKHYGNLTVTKTVTGRSGDVNKEWHFRVELSDKSVNGLFGEMDFVGGVAEFTLKSGESATAKDLPAGITYTVTEEEANLDGYETTSTGENGVIPADGTAQSDFINRNDEWHRGDLTVTKTVTGEAGDVNKEWHFRVELSDTSVNGLFGEMNFVDGVAEFTLKSGESATAKDLPAKITYTVTEEEANLDGYETSSTNETGTIPDGDTVQADFLNHKDPPPPEKHYGNLTVTKTVTGEAGDISKEWHFRVELSDKSVNGTFGEMDFVDGVAEFVLKSGESATAKDLLAEITYTVTEEEANLDGYETTSTGENGVIPEDGTAQADFLNHKDPPPPEKHYGNLTVTKTVTGEAGDLSKEWHFRVELSDRSVNGLFGEMDFVDGVAEFVLKSGESATAKDLPAGITYTVTEEEANLDGYKTTSTGENGVIPEDGTAQADFTNRNDDKETELPDKPFDNPHGSSPNTGADSSLVFWIVMMFFSVAGMMVTSAHLFGESQLVGEEGKHSKK